MTLPSIHARPLAVLTTSYPRNAEDGAGTFVWGFCQALARGGHRVEVLCPKGPSDRGCGVTISEPEPGIRVLRLPYAWPGALRFLGTSPGAPESLVRAPLLWGPALAFGARLASTLALRTRSQGYGAVVAHWLVPSALAGVLGAPSVPTLGIAHGSDVHLLGRLPGGRLLCRILLTRAAGLSFVSEDLMRRFGALLPESMGSILEAKSVVAPMGVDLPAPGGDREAARRTLGLGGPVILWMGRLAPVKAPERALGLARALGEALPGATLVMAGDGPLGPTLRAQARPFGDRVRFTGFVSGTRKRDLLAAADVLVITSTTLADGRTDSMPVTVLEALSAGLPVVGTAVGGLPGLAVPEGALRLVSDGPDVRVIAALAAAVTTAIAGGRLDEPAREALSARFGWENALPRILAPLAGCARGIS